MKTFDILHLYFADDLDIAKVLTTVGVTVTIDNVEIKFAFETGDLGGEPEGLDCTPLSATVAMEKAGLVQQEKWNVRYYMNDDDFTKMEALKASKESKPISVNFPDGTKFTNTGNVAANYASGLSVNGVAVANAVIELSGADGWQYVSATNV